MNRRNALTLIELVLVLVILSILATVAVQMLEPQVDQSRFEATQKTITAVDEAIVGSPNQRSADGTPLYTGFIADLGRLPVARFDDTGTQLTLRELWQPMGMSAFSVRSAIVANGAPADQEDAEVLVPCGWNGPYLRLPVGSRTLNDGWGNNLVSLPGPTTVFSHLRGTGDIDITSELESVYGVRSLGANNVFDLTDTGYDVDVPVSLNITDSRIQGVVTGTITYKGAAPDLANDLIVVQLYGPNPTDGLVRVDRFPTTGFVAGTGSFTFADSDANYNVKIGPHAVRAYRDTNGDGKIDGADERSQIVYFSVRPGMNQLPVLNIP